jgi:hypothetical protein
MGVREAVEAQIAGLPGAIAHPGLAAAALVLASKLDDDAGMATAAVARELRATLTELEGEGTVDDELADLVGRLSAPVRNEA